MTLGDSCFGVNVNPSGDPRIVDIKRRAAGPIEVSIGEDRPSGIAQFQALSMKNIETGTMRTAKAAALSGCRVTRPVPCRLVAAVPSVEAPLAIHAASLERCSSLYPLPTRRCAALHNKTALRHIRSISSSRPAGRARVPDAEARWCRPAGLQAASTRPPPPRDGLDTPVRYAYAPR